MSATQHASTPSDALPRAVRRRPVRFSSGYLKLAVSTFALELFIALFMHDGYVRPLLGDALVVVLIYAAALSAFDLPRVATALGVFVFACAVEVAQYFQAVYWLGLEHSPLARVVIGTSFDPWDFLAYGAGALLVIVMDPARAA